MWHQYDVLCRVCLIRVHVINTSKHLAFSTLLSQLYTQPELITKGSKRVQDLPQFTLLALLEATPRPRPSGPRHVSESIAITSFRHTHFTRGSIKQVRTLTVNQLSMSGPKQFS